METFKKMDNFWKLLMAIFILLSTSTYVLADPNQASIVVTTVKIKNNSTASGTSKSTTNSTTNTTTKSTSNPNNYNPDGSQILPHHVPKEVARGYAIKRSPANSSQILNLRIVLPSKDEAGRDNLLQEIYNPKSPNFHKYLTHQQVIQQFGADPVNLALVKEELKANGLTVTGQSDDGCILSVVGPVSAVQKMFKLNINNYQGLRGVQFFAPDSNPTLSTTIAGKVKWVLGIDNVRKYHHHSYKTKSSGVINAQVPKTALKSLVTKAASGTNASSPRFSGPIDQNGNHTISPSDFLTAYNISPLNAYSPSIIGTGQTQALFELDGYLAGGLLPGNSTPFYDVTKFTNYFNLSMVPSITVVPVDGGITTPGEGLGEADLDIDMSIAVAPGLTGIRVYEADQNTQANAWIDE